MDELFYNIDNKQKAKLLKEIEANLVSYNKNTYIMSNMRKENIICILLSGHIQIIKNDYNGNRTIIDDIKENEIFGTMTHQISNNEYLIQAKEDTKIIVIDFLEIINADESRTYYQNQFLKNLLKILANKINSNNKRIEILSNKSIRDKLLHYFKLNNNNKIVTIPFSITDLADYLAVNRSAMSREIRNLKDEGMINIKGKKISLLYELD